MRSTGSMPGCNGTRRSWVGAFALVAVLAIVGAACAAPPPACPPEAQRTMPAAALLGVTGGDPSASVFAWLASWWWANPQNCPPPDPVGPPAVVPEAPLAVLLPAVALLSAGVGLIVVRRRRLAPT